MWTVLLRFTGTLFNVPQNAMLAELSADYHERTALLAWRYGIGYCGGVVCGMVLMGGFLQDSEEGARDFFFHVQGYNNFGLFLAFVMAFAMTISSFGTHYAVPRLNAVLEREDDARPRLAEVLNTVRHAFAERSFVCLMLSAAIGAAAAGITSNLLLYFNNFMWVLSQGQNVVVVGSLFFSIMVGLLVAYPLSRRIGKKRASILLGLTGAIIAPLPQLLYLEGSAPKVSFDQEQASPSVMGFLVCFAIPTTGLQLAGLILTGALLVDLVEQAELKTSRRNEGVFFAAMGLIDKCVNAIGTKIASSMISDSGFPSPAIPGEDYGAEVRSLAKKFVPAVFCLSVAASLVLAGYSLTKASHEANLKELSSRPSPASRSGHAVRKNEVPAAPVTSATGHSAIPAWIPPASPSTTTNAAAAARSPQSPDSWVGIGPGDATIVYASA